MDIVRTLKTVMNLKKVRRAGWVREGIDSPESVADHTYGVSALALLLPVPSGVNRERLLAMAVVHDLAESIIGDIVWETGDSQDLDIKREKTRREREVIEELEGGIGGDTYKDLAIDYLEQRSQEAKYLKQLDKLEMGIQALMYARQNEGFDPANFLRSVRKYIVEPELVGLWEKVETELS